MSILNSKLTFLSTLALSAVSSAPQSASAATPRLSFDFNAAPTWKGAKPYASSAALGAKAGWAKVGSYNQAGTTNQSGGWRLSANTAKAPRKWFAGLVSGVLPVKSSETNLGKLTLAFTLSASANRPVKVKIASLNAKGARTGGLETLIYPAAPDFLQRYALDLNTFKPSGTGKFDPRAPQIQFAFEMDSNVWPAGQNEIRVDDVNYCGPAFYVSPNGKDTNDGKTEATAFATPQKAIDLAQAGDIVLLMEGTYNGGASSVANFPRAGSPAGWIVLKNYPGHKPKVMSNAWNTISIAKGTRAVPDETSVLGYLEVRGLHVLGEGNLVKTKFPDAINKSDPRSNTNGIAADGRYMKNTIHHLRFADNLLEYNPGQGVGAIEADWITIENNISRYNCWTTIYAASGISTMGASNFDSADNIYKILIRNNTAYRNEIYYNWSAVNRISDGNGIILDVNQKTDERPNGSYLGRTLVQSNLSYDNGGSGIHAVRANRVDIIGNTAYMNSASPALQYSQIYTWGSEDVRIFNNIMVARVADVAAGEQPEPVNRISGPNKDVIFKNNIYLGGNIAPFLGEGDRIIDPNFSRASTDPKAANFRLTYGSPADSAALVVPFAPYLNLDGQVRGAQPNIGAY